MIGKIKTLLIGSLLAAVAWPLWLVNSSKLIDNAYSVAMVRRPTLSPSATCVRLSPSASQLLCLCSLVCVRV